VNFLVIGSGGREHALVWALSQSEKVNELHAAPGNPGMKDLATLHSASVENKKEILALAKKIQPDYIIVGPEAPLVVGASDLLRKNGFKVFGPGREGASLEGSKIFAKEFMARHSIPTAPFDVCLSIEEGEAALNKRQAPFVVKADGLAAGKGAFVLQTREEALAVISNLLVKKELGTSGEKIIIEDFMPGLELTILCVSDGKNYRILPGSQDHKRVFDHDQGPNTGGMGAYCPVPWVDEDLLRRVEETVISPTFSGLRSENISYCGVLYFGLMIDPDGSPRVVEYNVRFGDPEAEVVLPTLNVDFAQLIMATCDGNLRSLPKIHSTQWAVDVVMTSEGYPGAYTKGYPITGLDEAAATGKVLVFHAGTALNEKDEIVTAGGRVLNVVGLGKTLEEALEQSYKSVRKIHFTGAHYRKDIAAKAR
jgi:phosphoribosylamine--glycine ligase